jgi:hypothetical protein
VLALLFSIRPVSGQAVSWEDLEARGTILSGIEIRVVDVFDPRLPDERHWLGRLANWVHVETRHSVVQREILFKAGERVDARLIRQTAVNLRALDFVEDAYILPVEFSDGTVKAFVEVRDAWSLRLGLRFERVGGDNIWRIRLQEMNLLGFGKRLILSYEQGLVRTATTLGYLDPQLFGSHWVLDARYSNLSDGKARSFRAERPFFELHVPWSAGVRESWTESVLTLYFDRFAAFSVPMKDEAVNVFGSWAYAFKDRTAYRIGVAFRVDETNYGRLTTFLPGPLPAPEADDRRYLGPQITWSVAQDLFQDYKNLASISRTEDLNLGWLFRLGLGCYLEALGSDRNAPFGEFTLSKGWGLGRFSVLRLDAWGSGRRPAGSWEDLLGNVSFTAYNQRFPLQTLAANAVVAVTVNPDLEDWLYLGGVEGLRGYPNWFRTGDQRWLVSFEDRVVTPWRLWGMVQIGFVAFADAGAIRSLASGSWSRVYADVGGGLRFGNLKSSFGRVLVLAVVFPLTREPGVSPYEIVVGNVMRF